MVEAIDPYTEAHRMAILSNTMVMFGNVIGGGPYFRVEYTNHQARQGEHRRAARVREIQRLSAQRLVPVHRASTCLMMIAQMMRFSSAITV